MFVAQTITQQCAVFFSALPEYLLYHRLCGIMCFLPRNLTHVETPFHHYSFVFIELLQEGMNIDLTTNPSDPNYDLTKKRIAEERHRVSTREKNDMRHVRSCHPQP